MTRRTLISRGALALVAAVLPAARLRAEVSPVMEALSRYMAAAKDHPLPADVLDAVKQQCSTRSPRWSPAPSCRPARPRFALPPRRRASGGDRRRLDHPAGPMDAALVNGVLAHSDETDDSHGAVAVASRRVDRAGRAGRRGSVRDHGAQFLRAVALGYDIGPRVTMALGAADVPERDAPQHAQHRGNVRRRGGGRLCGVLDAQQMRWLLDYASQQSSGIRGLGAGHRPHREGIRLRGHARAQRRHRRPARALGLQRRRRCLLGGRQLLPGQCAQGDAGDCWSRGSGSATRSRAPTSRNGPWARRSRRRSTRSRTCAASGHSRRTTCSRSSCGWRLPSARWSTTATSRTSACSTWSP